MEERGKEVTTNKHYMLTTHHFVVDFVEMDLADFIDNILALKRDKSKA